MSKKARSWKETFRSTVPSVLLVSMLLSDHAVQFGKESNEMDRIIKADSKEDYLITSTGKTSTVRGEETGSDAAMMARHKNVVLLLVLLLGMIGLLVDLLGIEPARYNRS